MVFANVKHHVYLLLWNLLCPITWIGKTVSSVVMNSCFNSEDRMVSRVITNLCSESESEDKLSAAVTVIMIGIYTTKPNFVIF